MKHAIISFGRMNPPTIGHQKLVDKIKEIAKKSDGRPLVFLSHSQDSRKNPLPYSEKLAIAKKAFGPSIIRSKARSIIEVLKELEKEYTDVTVVVGSDRVQDFTSLVSKYNGKEYNFNSIKVISAGERDPDAEGVAGMSASKLRSLASQGDFEQFKKGLPTGVQGIADRVFKKMRDGMNIKEEENIHEVLSVQQRLRKRQSLRRIKSRIKLGRRKARYKLASKEKLEKRSQKKARQTLRKRLAGKQGERYKDLPLSARIAIDRKLEKRKKAIKQIAKRLMPKVRKAEYERLRQARASKNEDFHIFNVDGRNIELSESEFLELINYMIANDVDESVQKNLSKKSDKYSIPYEQLEKRYKNLKQEYFSESEVFDKLNIWIIREAIANAAQKRAREAIKREKQADKVKHDRAMDTARLQDARYSNRITKRT